MTILAAWMASKNLKDEEVAETLGWSRTQVLRVRNGSSRPSPAFAAALEGLTGIPAWEFIKPQATSQPPNNP